MIWSRSQAVYALLIRQPIVRFFASHFSYARWPGRCESRINVKQLSIIRNLEAMSDQVRKESPNPTLSPTQAEGKGNAGFNHFTPCPLYGGKGRGIGGCIGLRSRTFNLRKTQRPIRVHINSAKRSSE